jgi:preprotein translocase subunit SecA
MAVAAQAKMAEHFPKIVEEIDKLVTTIAERVARLPPDRLLHRAWWEFAAAMLNLGRKKGIESEQLDAMRMVDYVQSVIASVKPEAYADEVSEDNWNKLKADVVALFHRLTLEYQLCLTAHRKAEDPAVDMALETFRFRAETLWLNIRGKRYHNHEQQALLDILAPHSDILVKLFGADAPTFAAELAKVLHKLTHGLGEAMDEMAKFQDDTLGRIETLAHEHTELGLDALTEKVFEDQALAARRERVAGEVFGMDLFDVGKNTTLPQALLDQLAWSPGEDSEFFSLGDCRGWPLRIWPIMKRPFIRINGRVFCFDIFSLFDNIHRVMRRLIVKREPNYNGTWNDRQKAASEELPFTYLDRLLPGALIYKPVYYKWKAGAGRAQWHEADGLLIYDDHLLIIEVKAGAFTYTSPADDLGSHLDSLRNLMQSPARQGSRFWDYLESAPEVSLFDADHNEIGRVRRSDFRHITVCAVTLDAFTELAARAQHLADVGIDVGQRAVWSVSIDDLRVYADLFDNSLIFLHFIEQRMRAALSKHVDLNDELDHLGLYIAQNNYSQFAEEMKASQELTKLNFDGFRTPIDDYFSALVRGDAPELPRQTMPPRLADIILFLAASEGRRRSDLASFLLDGAGDFHDELAAAIDQALRENKELGRARPLSFYGHMAMTLYVWSPPASRHQIEAEEHTRAVMVANDEATRRLVELEYSEGGVLLGVHTRGVCVAGLSNTELSRLKRAGTALRQRRVEKAREKRKIGVNEPCPCGSGKKFKRCHGRRA